MPDIHNVFVAHRHEDDAKIGELKELLKGKGVDIRSSSITSDKPNKAHNPDYIKREILRPAIKWAGKVIVLITPETKNHEWVDWEINCAEDLNKPIIGVWARGSAGCEIPDALERHADAVVGWNSEHILRALNNKRLWETSDGSQRGEQAVKRIGC